MKPSEWIVGETDYEFHADDYNDSPQVGLFALPPVQCHVTWPFNWRKERDEHKTADELGLSSQHTMMDIEFRGAKDIGFSETGFRNEIMYVNNGIMDEFDTAEAFLLALLKSLIEKGRT